jgi:putative ABC transport system permease protein
VTTYIPYLQNNPSYFTYVIRSANPQNLAGPIREAFRSIDAEQPLYNIRTMEEVVRSSFWEEGFFSEMFGVFAAIALLLAAVGIYGIVSYAVNQRVHEIGIRVALGAGADDVLRLMVGQGMLPVLVGIGIGIVLSLAVTQVLSDLLYAVSPWDPLTFVSISAVLMAVAVAACYIPARRAMQVDPVVALRHE